MQKELSQGVINNCKYLIAHIRLLQNNIFNSLNLNYINLINILIKILRSKYHE